VTLNPRECLYLEIKQRWGINKQFLAPLFGLVRNRRNIKMILQINFICTPIVCG